MRNFGFFRVAVASIVGEVANPAYNGRQVQEVLLQAAQQDVACVVFSELCITGYTCGDLFLNDTLEQRALEETIRLGKQTKELGIAAIVGLPLRVEGKLYNCAAFLADGEIKGFVPKRNIPNYSEFYELRWFAEGTQASGQSVQIEERMVPVDSDLLFSVDGTLIGIEICEDLWTSAPPSARLSEMGALILCNPSASNALVGKNEYRVMLVEQTSAVTHSAYLFASTGLGESSTDTLYNGHSIICENGTLLKQGQQSDFSSLLLIEDIDLQLLLSERQRLNTFLPVVPQKRIEVDMRPKAIQLQRAYSATPFFPSEPEKKNRAAEEALQIQSFSLAKRLRYIGTDRMVIGVSGGLDSTLALLVAARTADLLKIKRTHIYGVTMPGFGTSNRTKNQAKELMRLLGVTAREISIVPACRQHFQDIGQEEENQNVVYENAQARERAQILLDVANQLRGIVVGTGDLSEMALGFTTFAGDHISMYGVNAGVPKTFIREMIARVSEQCETSLSTVLREILNTPRSPELIPPDCLDEVKQRTERIVGDYLLHDFFLYYFLRYGFGFDRIFYMARHVFEGQYEEDTIRLCLQVFIKRFFSQQFKRNCVPDGPKVCDVSLSPRSDWKMPSDASVQVWLRKIGAE